MSLLRIRFSSLASGIGLASLLLVMACAAPASTSDSSDGTPDAPSEYVAVHDSATVSPICPDVNFYLTETVRENYSVGTSNYQNGDYCGALLYLRWVRDNDALYTGADPDAVIEQAILTIERMAEAARSLHGGLVESKGEIKGLIRKAMSHATRVDHKADAAGLDRAYDALSEATSALARAEHSL